MATPNFYSLTGTGISITYNTTTGTLEFTGTAGPQTFTAPELTSVSTSIGTLVTFPTHTTIDTGATLLSFLLPFINLPTPVSPVTFSTIGIITQVKGPDSFPRTGAGDFYSTVALSGTASDFFLHIKLSQKP
jgi:hypothetical protein